MTKKLYPFSMRKYGHNIELAYNTQWIICDEMDKGERQYDSKAFDWKQQLMEAYSKAMRTDGRGITYVDGKTYGILNKANLWAMNYRDMKQWSNYDN